MTQTKTTMGKSTDNFMYYWECLFYEYILATPEVDAKQLIEVIYKKERSYLPNILSDHN